jgi:hypothetical protein
MKKSLIAPILTVIGLVLIAAIFVYFYISLNRLESKTIALQTEISTDSNKVSAIVNFLNANTNTNAQTTK